MRVGVIFLIIAAVLFVLAFVVRSEHRPQTYFLPAVQAEVVPWQLNTRCTINSGNLPVRNPEEVA